MPIYEFTCKKCGHAFETIQGIDNKTPGALNVKAKRWREKLPLLSKGLKKQGGSYEQCRSSK